MNQPFTSLVAQRIDVDEYRERAGTPGHQLIEGGAKPDNENVKRVVTTEGGLLGAVHADEHMKGTGITEAVDAARGRYKGALGALPPEVRERIGAGDVDGTVKRVEGDFRRELQRGNGRATSP